MTIMKRTSAPIFWPIERKTKKFVISPKPGPHRKNECIPLGVIIRDVLHYAKNVKEVKKILNNRIVKVDGKIRKDIGFPVGLMDVLSIGNENFRLLPNKNGLYLQKIDEKETSIKLEKIINKTCIGKKIQLNLHDGKNILVENNNYKTGDTIVINLNDNSIKDVFRFEKGSIGLVIRGKRIGFVGRIDKINITKSPRPNEVVMLIGERKVTLPKDYVFIIGKEKPAIALGD
ncbi:MAG: 30S ribosomal protein S4e [Candidatus Aenigmatarchaeota archaeon]